MGVLAQNNEIDAGLFSLADYLRFEESLELLPLCIATRDQVKSVMLFSNHGWLDLNGKVVGICDDTATSVKLLRVLLETKYGVTATFKRMHAGVNDYSSYDAVLLIGDEALRFNRTGLGGFELVFDLAREWYEWKKLPFVFAVWAVKKAFPENQKNELHALIQRSLETSETGFDDLGKLHARSLGLTPEETSEYLGGFNYRIGEREKAAIEEFRFLLTKIETEKV